MNLTEFQELYRERLTEEYGNRADAALKNMGRSPIQDSKTSGFLDGITFCLEEMLLINKGVDSKPGPAFDPTPPSNKDWLT